MMITTMMMMIMTVLIIATLKMKTDQVNVKGKMTIKTKKGMITTMLMKMMTKKKVITI